MSAEFPADRSTEPSPPSMLRLSAKSLIALVALQFMLAWWRRYGGWITPVPSTGMYGPSLPPWMMALIGDMFLLAPSLVCGALGWLFALSVWIGGEMDKSEWASFVRKTACRRDYMDPAFALDVRGRNKCVAVALFVSTLTNDYTALPLPHFARDPPFAAKDRRPQNIHDAEAVDRKG